MWYGAHPQKKLQSHSLPQFSRYERTNSARYQLRQVAVEVSWAEGTFVIASTKNNDCVERPAFSNAFVKTANGLFRLT